MKIRTIIGTVITIGVIGGLLVVIPPGKVLPYLRRTDPVYLGLACLVNFVTIALRARRWQLLLAYIKKLDFSEVFRALTIGIAVNSVVPLRAGEAMRACSLAQRHGLSKRESGSTVLVDRSFDAISFGLLVLLAGRFFPLPGIMSSRTYGLAFSSLALTISFPLVAWLGRTIRTQPREKYSSDLQRRIALKLEPLLRGYSSLTTGGSLMGMLLSVVAWIPQFVAASLAARAIGVHLPLGALVMAVLAVHAVSALPLTPANVGVFQIAFLFTLSAYGIDRTSSFAVAALFQAVLVIPVAVAGLIMFNHRRHDTETHPALAWMD